MRRRLLLIEARQEALFRRAEPFDNLRISDVVKAVMKYKRLRESSYFCSFAKLVSVRKTYEKYLVLGHARVGDRA